MTTQKANTRKTSSLLKKYLQDKYGVQFKVRTEKYSMGSSLSISYTCGPDTKLINSEVDKLQYGYFNGMEDIYEHVDKAAFIIDGWELEQQKYVRVEQDIPSELFYSIAKFISDNRKFTGVPELESIEQINDSFPERFGSAWTWRDMAYQMFKNRNFHTDDFENIKIVAMEDDTDDHWNTIFTYEYKGENFKTK